jgi:hypothetical protein
MLRRADAASRRAAEWRQWRQQRTLAPQCMQQSHVRVPCLVRWRVTCAASSRVQPNSSHCTSPPKPPRPSERAWPRPSERAWEEASAQSSVRRAGQTASSQRPSDPVPRPPCPARYPGRRGCAGAAEGGRQDRQEESPPTGSTPPPRARPRASSALPSRETRGARLNNEMIQDTRRSPRSADRTEMADAPCDREECVYMAKLVRASGCARIRRSPGLGPRPPSRGRLGRRRAGAWGLRTRPTAGAGPRADRVDRAVAPSPVADPRRPSRPSATMRWWRR